MLYLLRTECIGTGYIAKSGVLNSMAFLKLLVQVHAFIFLSLFSAALDGTLFTAMIDFLKAKS